MEFTVGKKQVDIRKIATYPDMKQIVAFLSLNGDRQNIILWQGDKYDEMTGNYSEEQAKTRITEILTQ